MSNMPGSRLGGAVDAFTGFSQGASSQSGLGGLFDTVANAVSTVSQVAEAVTNLVNQVGGGAAGLNPQDTQQTAVF